MNPSAGRWIELLNKEVILIGCRPAVIGLTVKLYSLLEQVNFDGLNWKVSDLKIIPGEGLGYQIQSMSDGETFKGL